MCSLDCNGKFCADTAEPNTTATFCAVAGTANTAVCVARCSFTGYPTTGCRTGYTCSTLKRYNDTSAEQDVCVPATDGHPQITQCRMDVARAGNTYSGWVAPQATASGTSTKCEIVDPLVLANPVNGMKVLYNMKDDVSLHARCELAAAIMKTIDIAKSLDIVELYHLGTYNCRAIAGTNTISQHGYGRAIDIQGVKMKSGEVYTVLDHWEKGVANPQTPGGKVLFQLVHALHDQKVFNILLTPEYNADHANHFHVDLTPNADFIRDEGGSFLGEFDGVE